MDDSGTPRRSIAARALTVIGLLVVVAGVALAVVPSIPVPIDAFAMVGAFSAYAVVVAALGAGLVLAASIMLRSRRGWFRSLGPLLVVVGLVIVQAPRWIPDDRPPTGPAFTLASINLHLGWADADSITAATADADVVAFTEITTAETRRLAGTAFATRFPYWLENVTLPNRGAEGTMVYSRWPLEPAGELYPPSVHQNWVTSVSVPGIGPVTVVAVHAQRPFLTGDHWLTEHRGITAALPTDPLTVVAGDFNASPDQVSASGYTSAVDITGAGWIRTFPVDPIVPRLLRIDHVLLGSGLTATSVSTLAVDRTDHLGLRTVIARRAS